MKIILFLSILSSFLCNELFLYHKDEKEFSSCKLIFLDLGANIGVQARRLYEFEKYPKRGELNNLFDKYFGLTNRNLICTFAFEPNPRHKPRLKEMEAVYHSLDIRYYFLPYGVSTINTSFYLLKPNSDTQMAASLIKTNTNLNRPINSVKVQVINLLDFLTKFIVNNLNIQAILCKMDIEGEEYNLLPSLISSGLICLIDTLTVEFHLSRSSRFQDSFIKKFKRSEVIEFQKNLRNYTIKFNTNKCKTEFIKLDDELYHSDNLLLNPLPLYKNAPIECTDAKKMCILTKSDDDMTEQQYKETIYGIKRWA